MSLRSTAQYNVTSGSSPYVELTGATELVYSPTDDGYYFQANFVFPVFGSRLANLNLSIPNSSNGGFISSEGYLAVYESPDYENTVAFQCLSDTDFETVPGLTKVSAKVEGLPGNRIAKFQWKDLVKGTDTSQRINFQTWLHESDSTVSYHYGPNTFPDNANQSYCGIIVLDPTFTALLDQCNAEGNPAQPAVYDSIPVFSLPTLDSIPLNGTVITFKLAASSTGISGTTVQSVISCYPNPVIDILNVDVEHMTADACNISIRSIYGQVLYNRNVAVQAGKLTETISLAQFASGIYTLQIEGDGISISGKIEKR